MMHTLRMITLLALSLALVAFVGCSDDDDSNPMSPSGNDWMATNPDDAPTASIDRFSADAGMLMVRDGSNGLPEANEPIDFDSGEPFITMGLGPDGEMVQYYNFDVQPTTPAPIYVLVREGEMDPVAGQLNIVDVIPGDDGYNDFWQPHFVTVPEDYVANAITSYDQLMEGDYAMEAMPALVNCPIVPEGSTADMRLGDESAGLTRGWYKDQVVFYFNFSEKDLAPAGGMVPLSPIYVSFNINPDMMGGGPPSGFMTESGSAQTHNVLATLPDDASYSPLWSVNPYDNADFSMVFKLDDALMANILDMGVATVNCPVVSIGDPIAMPMDPDSAPVASVDRFSADAGNLMVRDGSNGLPEANEPINFDSGEPFITKGLGPDGQMVEYYNFDVQPTEPAPIYVLIREGESDPVEGQLNVVDVKPGDDGYNDFWQVNFVTVPATYAANTIHNADQIMDGGYDIETTDMLVNCPIVPEGSTASKRYSGGDTGLTRGWYKDQVVYYFNFVEHNLTASGGMVPVSPIYVSFNTNPDEMGGGPPSGFKTEMGSAQTHNVVATLPADMSYSPLWSVNPYDNADFDDVMDLDSALNANILGNGVALVNCPIVTVP